MRIQLTIFLAIGVALTSVAVVGGKRIEDLDRMLREGSRSANSAKEAGAALMARELERQREERNSLVAEIERLEGELTRLEGEREGELDRLRAEFLGSQDRLRDLLTSSSDQLTVLESSVSRIEGAEYSSLIQELGADVRGQWSALEARVEQASGQLESTRALLVELDGRLEQERDLDAMWRDVMGPVVQLAGDSSVGSGVLLRSMPIATSDEPGYRTLVLTAWHVVRDIQEGRDLDHPVPVTIYDRIGAAKVIDSSVIARDVSLDICLLELGSREHFAHGAILPTDSRMKRAQVFEPVYAVGCPLGNDPIPTRGEVSDTSHDVDGRNYWMINAPTFIGNSGGGIFDAESHELLGIFSKIYNYGAVQQTIIPHMGLVTPMDAIYDWVEAEGLELSAE